MKKRIIALVLVVVMSVLSLASCGSFNFVKEDLSQYATFDYAAFKAAYAKLEIEDGDFTADGATRELKTLQTIYTKLANAIVAATEEADYKKEGTIGGGDVLYYVYQATDADGNIYFTSEMKESSITASSTKADHVIQLGAIDVDDKDADEIKKLIKANLVADADLKDYVYSMLVAADIEEQVKEDESIRKNAEDAYKAANPGASDADVKKAGDEAVKAAVEAALKVKEGDIIVISYNREYTEKTTEGVETTVKQSAAYETIVIDNENPLYKMFIAEHSVAKVGGTLAVKDDEKSTETEVKTTETFKVDINFGTEDEPDVKSVKYSNVKILWKVENEGKAIAEFKYTYTKDKNVTPDNCRKTTAGKVNLKDKELTFTVYPVYAIEVNEVVREGSVQNAIDILTWIVGSGMSADYFEIFEDDGYVYKEEGKDDVKVKDLVKDIISIYAPTEKDNEFYKEGTDLQKLYKDYTDKKAISDKSGATTAQKTATTEAQTALTKKQRETAADYITKIANAVKGEDKACSKIVGEYYDDTFHSLKETYDSTIVKNVQKAVWDLIQATVKVDKSKLPEKLVKEYKEHLYDSYEYDYYKGKASDNKTANYDKYASFNAFLMSKDVLDCTEDKIDSKIEELAKSYIEPIIQIYVVSKAVEADALKVVKSYVEADKANGYYDVDEDAIKKQYGDKADAKIKEAKENAKESYEKSIEEAEKFLINDAYIKEYKKEIGSAYYRQLTEEYGEINLRAALQFNKLFYYLTSTNIVKSEDGGHSHTEVKYDENGMLDFRTVGYTIKVESTESND